MEIPGSILTNPFTILELPSPSQDVPELHKIRLSPDHEALKLGKGSSVLVFISKTIEEEEESEIIREKFESWSLIEDCVQSPRGFELAIV